MPRMGTLRMADMSHAGPGGSDLEASFQIPRSTSWLNKRDHARDKHGVTAKVVVH